MFYLHHAAQDPDQPNKPPVEPNLKDRAQAEGEQFVSQNRAVFQLPTTTREGIAGHNTFEKEKLLEKETRTAPQTESEVNLTTWIRTELEREKLKNYCT